MRFGSLALVLCALILGSLGAAPAEAASPKRLEWNPAFRAVGPADYVIVGTGVALAVAAAIVRPISPQAQTNAFDESVRQALRLDDIAAQHTARGVSDVTVSLLIAAPMLVDDVLLAAWHRQSPHVAYEMAVIDAEAFAITAALQGVTNTLAARQRPYGRDCGTVLPEDGSACRDPVRFRSFFSGHSSFAFTGAALTCAQHLRFGLWGGGAPEVATCIAAFALAGSTATLRVVGDMHYASDVLTGAAVGTLVGFLVPALHWGLGAGPSQKSASGLAIHLTAAPNGLGIGGQF